MWDPDVPFCSLGGVLCGDRGCCGDSGAVSGGWMEEKKKHGRNPAVWRQSHEKVCPAYYQKLNVLIGHEMH